MAKFVPSRDLGNIRLKLPVEHVGIFRNAGSAARRDLQVSDLATPVGEIGEEALERAHDGVVGNRRHYYNPYAARRFGRTAVLARQHLDVAVDAGNDLEFALVDLAFITGNGAIFALGKNHTRKGANRFLDDVTTRR